VVDRLFPEMKALQGCPQEPEWHPEGDVWVHTLMAVDQAKREIDGLPIEKALTVLLAVICHDFGKPSTTAVVDGRIRSYEHEEAGILPARAFLDRLNIRTLHGYDVREQVVQARRPSPDAQPLLQEPGECRRRSLPPSGATAGAGPSLPGLARRTVSGAPATSPRRRRSGSSAGCAT